MRAAARPRGWLRAVSSRRWRSLFVGARSALSAFSRSCAAPRSSRPRNADGIVVLTGGSSRVSDAMELLAGRLRQAAADLGRAPDQCRQRHFPHAARQPVAARLLRRSRPLRGQHPQQCGGDPALGARARLQVADRGDIELPHAARHRGTVACDARCRADPVRGGRRQMARRAVVDEWRDAAAPAIGIRQICRGRGAGPAGRCRHGPGARDADQPAAPPPRRPATAQAN